MTEFKTKHLKVQLQDHLKLITTIVHQSSYCSCGFADLTVTINSLKPGTGYIYLEGILKSNDNKALVMLSIKIADNGNLAASAPYIFTTDPNFNKIPTTVQKELQTNSAVDGLDTSEPAENPNITPCVNVNEINSKFASFNSEDSIKPKVLIGFCTANNKWCINYTKDSNITDESDFMLYEKSYDGLLDCINESFNLLTPNRTKKRKNMYYYRRLHRTCLKKSKFYSI